MFVINDVNLLIIFTNYGPPLRLHQMQQLKETVSKAMVAKKTIHFIEDVFTPYDNICYLRGTMSGIAGLHLERKPLH